MVINSTNINETNNPPGLISTEFSKHKKTTTHDVGNPRFWLGTDTEIVA
jgi:hypothetical protein